MSEESSHNLSDDPIKRPIDPFKKTNKKKGQMRKPGNQPIISRRICNRILRIARRCGSIRHAAQCCGIKIKTADKWMERGGELRLKRQLAKRIIVRKEVKKEDIPDEEYKKAKAMIAKCKGFYERTLINFSRKAEQALALGAWDMVKFYDGVAKKPKEEGGDWKARAFIDERLPGFRKYIRKVENKKLKVTGKVEHDHEHEHSVVIEAQRLQEKMEALGLTTEQQLGILTLMDQGVELPTPKQIPLLDSSSSPLRRENDGDQNQEIPEERVPPEQGSDDSV